MTQPTQEQLKELIREAGRKPDFGYVFGRTTEKEKLLWGEDWKRRWGVIIVAQ